MNTRVLLKSMIDSRSPAIKCVTWIYNKIHLGNRCRIGKKMGGNTYKASIVLSKGTKVKVKGKHNGIFISPGTRLNNCKIFIFGDNNKVTVGDYCALNNVEIWIEDSNNEVFIGEHSSFSGSTHIACIEGTKVNIGKDCMFSANIILRTGDSHSVIDLDGNRINPSKNIKIGDHVWVGNSVIMTKGTVISDNSIVGTGSVVTRCFENGNIAIAGNPAKAVKNGISWDRKRLPIDE